MRESIHRTIRAPEQAKAIEMGRRAGYKSGGAVHEDEAEDKKLVKRMMRKREKGEPIDKLKGGGSAKVHGKETKARLDKKPRKAMGGPMVGNPAGMPQPGMPVSGAPVAPPMTQAPAMKKGGAMKKARGGSANTAYHEGVRTAEMPMKQPEINVDSERPKRAMGGGTGGKKHRGAKTNIIIHAGGSGADQANPMALQQAKQEGMKAGAMAVMAKLKGAGGPPGGAPGGAPMGPPPPGGAPPMGAPGMAPPMRAMGGKIRASDPIPKLHDTPSTVKVRAHVRRRGGACD